MSDEPDLNFDIDALFEHLTGNLDQNLEEVQEWTFSFRSSDFAILEQVGQELEDEFLVHLQESVEEIDEEGDSSLGDPMLILAQQAALSRDEVKAIAARMQQLADQHSLIYEGVECYEPIDEEEIFGWLEPEDAGWRLRHMTDCGLEENEELPWTFLVVTPSLEATSSTTTALDAAGYDDRDDYDEPDEDGNYGTCIFISGRNNEPELMTTAEKITKIAQKNGGRLAGIQFYTREDLIELFGDAEETE
ncbi:MAG: ribonuclease E inhibitor RraB [Planctomycetaceae bacterium]|nr:ribonuclease E inhibitor RraB [Planctomycetaceae bacterium]